MKIIFEGKKKNENVTPDGVSQQTPTEVKQVHKLSKEKIIIIALAVILVGLGLFVAWDLWGKNFSYNCPTTTTTTSTSTSTSSSTKKGGSNTSVDASLYASCTVKIADEKVYKSCCDALSADDTVKKACKKVVDDKNGTTPQTNTSTNTSN